MRTLMIGLLIAASAGAQTPPEAGDRARGLWNTEFSSKRPGSPAASKPGPAAAVSRHEPAALIGLTVWRLRRTRPPDAPGVRLLVHEADRSLEYTPERVNSTTELAEGERVRVSVEIAVDGYLYVISREKYADGSLGDPFLLFPTSRLRGGRNDVQAGVVVDLPSWEDRPPYWTLRRSRPDQTAELLLLLVSPTQLPEISPARVPPKLDPAAVAEWVRKWGVAAQTLEAPSEAGKPLTEAERLAGSSGRRLGDRDPLPQTILKVATQFRSPFLVTTHLSLRR